MKNPYKPVGCKKPEYPKSKIDKDNPYKPVGCKKPIYKNPPPPISSSSNNSEVIDLIDEWINWETKFLSDDECWRSEDGLPKFTAEVYEEYAKLQDKRNELLEKFSK